MDKDVREKQARLMSDKYLTVKEGPNVLHLDYFDGLLTKEEIKQINSDISKVGLELSHFDKTGVPHACIEDFILHSVVF